MGATRQNFNKKWNMAKENGVLKYQNNSKNLLQGNHGFGCKYLKEIFIYSE
jgi:hypothetical protein